MYTAFDWKYISIAYAQSSQVEGEVIRKFFNQAVLYMTKLICYPKIVANENVNVHCTIKDYTISCNAVLNLYYVFNVKPEAWISTCYKIWHS